MNSAHKQGYPAKQPPAAVGGAQPGAGGAMMPPQDPNKMDGGMDSMFDTTSIVAGSAGESEAVRDLRNRILRTWRKKARRVASDSVIDITIRNLVRRCRAQAMGSARTFDLTHPALGQG
jgi:hypothetical protein